MVIIIRALSTYRLLCLHWRTQDHVLVQKRLTAACRYFRMAARLFGARPGEAGQVGAAFASPSFRFSCFTFGLFIAFFSFVGTSFRLYCFHFALASPNLLSLRLRFAFSAFVLAFVLPFMLAFRLRLAFVSACLLSFGPRFAYFALV
jgi:hypothetical protein